MLTSQIQKLAGIGIFAAIVTMAAPAPQQAQNQNLRVPGTPPPLLEGSKPLSAYYESNNVQFVPEIASAHSASLGPWNFGKLLHDGKPLDKRLNLYVILPGKQYRSSSNPEYDHNLVVNALTHEKAREWDIFWCFILDSRLDDDLRSEHDLLNAAQQAFQPADLFDVEDIPGHEVLRERVGVQTLADLGRFRHKNGSLPRVLILPAHLAVSATAERPTADSAEKGN